MNQHQDRIICRALLYLDNLFNRSRIKRVGAQSVKAARREDDHPALLDYRCCLRDDFRLGFLRIYLSNN
jgi:hypothetical protein